MKIILASLGLALICGGCMHRTAISAMRPDSAPSFTQQEQETAKAIAVEIGAAAGFRQTHAAEELAATPSTWPYLVFVSLGAPGGDPEQRSVSILGQMRNDRRELTLSIADYERGSPLPATQQLIEQLRAALQREFPDCRVEVSSRRKLRLFGP